MGRTAHPPRGFWRPYRARPDSSLDDGLAVGILGAPVSSLRQRGNTLLEAAIVTPLSSWS